MLGGAAELLLASQRMTPDAALGRGFRFAHTDVASTVKDLVART
jgi:NAD dependent epimerase/dehydratase family enzyme